MQVLPNVFDRCKASRYFVINADGKHGATAIWFARVALNEFRSALELIPVDIKSLFLLDEWKKSTNKKELEENLIIKMLKDCRDGSFHAATVTPLVKERLIRLFGLDESQTLSIKTIFIDGLKNQRRNSRLKLNADESKKLIEIEDGIPVSMILAEGYAITCICLENFLIENGKISIEESDKFWNRYP